MVRVYSEGSVDPRDTSPLEHQSFERPMRSSPKRFRTRASMSRIHFWRRTALAALLICCTSCNIRESPSDDVVGSLKVRYFPGLTTVYAPKDKDVWWATYGNILLCAPSQLNIVAVAPTWKRPGLAFRATVRTTQSRGPKIRMSPVLSMRGHPPFEGPAQSTRLSGTFQPASGAPIERTCSDSGGGFTELLLSVKSGRGGSWLSGLELTYADGSSDGKFEIADLDMINCGVFPEVDLECRE